MLKLQNCTLLCRIRGWTILPYFMLYKYMNILHTLHNDSSKKSRLGNKHNSYEYIFFEIGYHEEVELLFI